MGSTEVVETVAVHISSGAGGAELVALAPSVGAQERPVFGVGLELVNVTVTVRDDDLGSDTESFIVTVSNVDPMLRVVGAQTIAEGSLLSLSNLGTFTDPGFDNASNPVPGEVEETFTYSINWGDGTIDFLFLAPERLSVPGFPERLAERTPALVAVDEAQTPRLAAEPAW